MLFLSSWVFCPTEIKFYNGVKFISSFSDVLGSFVLFRKSSKGHKGILHLELICVPCSSHYYSSAKRSLCLPDRP